MKKIKKRGAIYGAIALLLCVAVYLNWSYVDTPDELLAADPGQHGNIRHGRGSGLFCRLAPVARAGAR